MKIKCNTVQNLLSDYLDNILPEHQKVLIVQHLRHCNRCRQECKTLEITNRLLHFYVEKEPPEDYFEQLWSHLETAVMQRASQNPFSLQWLTAFLLLKLNGLKAGARLKYEIFKSLMGEKRKVLFQVPIVVCLILMSIFIDRAYIRPPRNSEFAIRNFLSPSVFRPVLRDSIARAREMGDIDVESIPSSVPDLRDGVTFRGSPVYPEKIGTQLHGQMGAIELDLRAIRFKDGILTVIANMDISKLADVKDTSEKPLRPFASLTDEDILMASQVSWLDAAGYSRAVILPRSLDIPAAPKVGRNSEPKLEQWLSNLVTDVTLPPLSLADNSRIPDVATKSQK